MSKAEFSASFNDIISWMVDVKEKHPHNRECKWSDREISYIEVGLSFMKERQKAAFLKRYRDYQIVKALAGDASCILNDNEQNFSITASKLAS